MQGWANFNTARSIASNPNASTTQKNIARGYVAVWGGAHAAVALGTAVIAVSGIAAAVTALTATAEAVETPEGQELAGEVGETVASDWAQLTGQLKDAASGKGNFGIGEATVEQADSMGDAWVGENAEVLENGIKISKDGLRQYRPPSYKPFLDMIQANLEYKLEGMKRWLGNAHIDIKE